MDVRSTSRGQAVPFSQEANMDEQEIRRRKCFLQFDEADEARLASIKGVAERYVDEVIDEFYRHLLSFEDTRVFFSDPHRLERVKHAQKQYFMRLTQGNYDTNYVENRRRIGAIHERIGSQLKSYLGMYSFFLRSVARRLFDTYSEDPGHALDCFLSLMKLSFLDISLAIDTYIDAREQTIREQQDAIRQLSTPVLPFRRGILILPIVGMIDTYRASQLTEQLLRSIRSNRARLVVIDITGVPFVDSRVAAHLVQTVEAARLMGTTTIVSGVSPEVALTMVTMGAELGQVETVGDLQSGIERAEYLSGYQAMKISESKRDAESLNS